VHGIQKGGIGRERRETESKGMGVEASATAVVDIMEGSDEALPDVMMNVVLTVRGAWPYYRAPLTHICPRLAGRRLVAVSILRLASERWYAALPSVFAFPRVYPLENCKFGESRYQKPDHIHSIDGAAKPVRG
jgi:hypothetical protein